MKAAPDQGGSAGLFDPEQHPSALEQAAIAALSAGDLKRAYEFADRRCRILPMAQARHYTLRAEIAHCRGFTTRALHDVMRAIELAPDDRAANRRLMQWGEGKHREAAARRLIGLDRDFGTLNAAVTALKASNEPGFGAIRRVGDSVTGWVTWKGASQPCVLIERDEGIESHPIESDPQHPLAQAVQHAASFDLPFVRSATRSVVRLLLGSHELARQAFPAPLGRSKPATNASRQPDGTARVTIIVPVYDDFDLTTRCLKSLARAIGNDKSATILLIDDATPDPRIAELLDGLATQQNVRLLRNHHNLGFIGAVNRALQTLEAEDVILLNADTIVPNGFVARLSAAAYASPDIGTVTPLSNNGEATSLPRPFLANPLLDEKEIDLLDGIAARCNAGRAIDMPDGIGFCLYIKRVLLDAIGGLSEHYRRGYLEDVDLCLRARQNGFRNVCATSVYVGHAGSASFKAEKRALVMSNLERLEVRFPDYRTESAVFKALDPLKAGRAAIERALAADHGDAVVVLTGPGAPTEAVAQFAETCGQPALIATLERSVLNLRNTAGSFPQSLNFTVPAERSALLETVRNFAFSRVVIADPARIPLQLAADLAANGPPIDLLVTDGGLWCRCGGLDIDRSPCAALVRGGACSCESGGRPDDWLAGLRSDSRIIAPDLTAAAFLRRRLPPRRTKQIHLIGGQDRSWRMRRPKKIASHGTTLGLLTVSHAPADYYLMRRVIHHVRQSRPQNRIVIFGETLDDLSLMALGNVTVTGAIATDELATLAKHYDLGGLAIARRAPLFGRPIMAAAFRDADVPLALVDWSFGNSKLAEVDLALAPASSESTIIAELLAWSAQWCG